ncbi:CPBP family intramembrane glutamic endopeptidase [Phenylobacterium aquaticum]|uniref:CPBP family intramembrane glutamic endopeptidase n=1 Tax=Phenylobacterium aquaticum TaxID=1763816 RepID=UPI0026EBAA49|nr:CPBP family intramembrane glutamic endopeptidase [Phenylobacterium aquaticum]
MFNSSQAVLLLAAALPLVMVMAGPLERRIYRSNPSTGLKFVAYGGNIVLLWAMAAAAVGVEGWGRLLQSPAPSKSWLWAPVVTKPVLAAAVGAYMLVALLPLFQSLRGPRWRRAYAAAYRRGFAEIAGMLPNTALERAAWALLSLTAGVCEELYFRGFLIRVLQERGPELPLAAALVVSSLIFGLGHLYQGAKGVLGTTIGGAGFGLLFLLTGSLIPGVVLHALIDLQIAYVLTPGREETAAIA